MANFTNFTKLQLIVERTDTEAPEEDNTVLKHSEYEDSESGLKLATAAMYDLVADSPSSDSAQLQRVMLSSNDLELVTTNITGKVVGKDYRAYSIL